MLVEKIKEYKKRKELSNKTKEEVLNTLLDNLFFQNKSLMSD